MRYDHPPITARARFGGYAALASALLLSGFGVARATLGAYDSVITADEGTGLTPVAKLTTAAQLTGAGGSAFNFGATSGDATMEFILEGNPGANNSACIAVGVNSTSSLRCVGRPWDSWCPLGNSSDIDRPGRL